MTSIVDRNNKLRSLTQGKPVISVKEAKKLLPKEYSQLSDEGIENIIVLLREIADDAVYSGSKFST
jgi:hypothetical protein